MSASLRVCGIILAAGASSRMGRDKAVLPWPPNSETDTLLSSAIRALKPFTSAVIVVAGHNATNLAPIAAVNGAELVRNPTPERGQFSSLRIGLMAALEHGCSVAMITPVDCPPLSPRSLEDLYAAFQQAAIRGAWAAAPENDERRGHPLIAGFPLIEAFLRAKVTSNAREIKHAHADKFIYVAVPDPLLAVDLNTPEEYKRAAGCA